MWINDRLESRDNMNGMEIHEHTILIVMNEDKKHLIKECDEVRKLIEVINMLKEKIDILIHNGSYQETI